MVEHQPSKLDTWVRFPSPALYSGGFTRFFYAGIHPLSFMRGIARFLILFGMNVLQDESPTIPAIAWLPFASIHGITNSPANSNDIGIRREVKKQMQEICKEAAG